jgi:hypothetical protein
MANANKPTQALTFEVGRDYELPTWSAKSPYLYL